jgi:hypothetical protein
MKQTAVEWLYNNLKSHFEHNGDLLEVVQFSFERYKEMEKYQIENAFYKGMQEQTARALINCLNTSPEQYYNETFKNK